MSAFAQIGDTPYTLSQNKALGNQNLKSTFTSSKAIIHLVNKTNRVLPIQLVDIADVDSGQMPKSIAPGQEATWSFSTRAFNPKFPSFPDPTVAINLDGVPSISISNDPHAYDDLYRGGPTAKVFYREYGNNDYILRTSIFKGLEFKITNIHNNDSFTTENTIEVTERPTYSRDALSVQGSRLCAVATPDCPNTMTIKTNSMIVSDHGTYAAMMQNDGNFVLYSHSSGIVKSISTWATGTMNKGGTRLSLQSDGNLVMYTADNKAVWASNTDGKGGSYVALGDDGNFGIYRSNGTPVWTTNTIWK